MGKLDHLKIKKSPACFATFAKNFNQQVDLLASIQGGPGIDVQVAHSPRKTISGPSQHKPKEQPRGKILLTLRPSAVNGLGVGSGTGGGGNVSTFAVGPEGTLVPILATGASPGSYPNYLQTGVTLAPGSWFSGSSGFGMIGNTNAFSLFVATALVTHNITVREFTGCNSGSPGNYLAIASDFF